MSCYHVSTISGSIIFFDIHGQPIVLSNDGRKIPVTLSFLGAIMHKKNFFCCFFPTILAGPQFVETQKFCYHGSVTSPFFYTVGTNSWLGNILDQIITWEKYAWIEGKWKSMKLACTDWFEKELLENNIIEKRNLCTLSKNILCYIMIVTDTRQCR